MAKELGIISESEGPVHDDFIQTGIEFSSSVGDINYIYEGDQVVGECLEDFQNAHRLRVLSNATPEYKNKLLIGL